MLAVLLSTASPFAQETAGFEKWLVHWVPAGAPEIVDWAQTPFGPVLAYTNSGEESVVFLDLAPVQGGEQPVEIASLALNGEPTSLATTADQRWFIVAVDTSDRDVPDGGSGEAVVISTYAAALGSPTAVTSIPLPGQPDSVATAGAFNQRRGAYAAIAIENETDEDTGNNLGTGSLVVIRTHPTFRPEVWEATTVDLTGLPIDRPDDPEPEFVDINDEDVAAVSLQENNALALVDLRTLEVVGAWDAGTVTQPADTQEEDIVSLADQIADSPRLPDAIGWLSDGSLALANEGESDLTGAAISASTIGTGRSATTRPKPWSSR